MENIVDELRWRGLIEQFSDEEKVRELFSTPQTVYCGFDPSASSMHLGNFVMISLLMRLQRAGHRIIALVGGATGMIGDPSGKSKERNLQGKEALQANTASIRAQLERFLDLEDPRKGIILNNYDWLGEMALIDFLRDYGKHFSVNYMLSKEIVRSRLEAGISFTEFSYQILQSVDFLRLYDTEGCRIQVGGNDQWGNLTSGLELIRKARGEEASCAAMTARLITRADGKKFGKSEDGALFLDPKLTSPYKLYQYFINCTDEDAVRYLKVFTFLGREEIEAIEKEHLASPGMRIAQKRLASEVVSLIHGEEARKDAVALTEALFSGKVEGLSKEQLDEIYLGKEEILVPAGTPILDALILVGMAPSKTQARTLLSQGSVSLNGRRIEPSEWEGLRLEGKDALPGKRLLFRKGKKNYYLATLGD